MALRALSVAIGAAILFAGPARAGETIAYTYDALGRLVQVVHSGTINNGANSNYTYDPADNRTNVTVATSASPPSFSVNDVSVAEGGNLSFTVTKTGPTISSFSVNYATANGTATAGSDYTSASNTLAFAAADTVKTVNVATIDDAAVEGSETVLLNLSGATGGATIGDPQGVGTITDNDAPANPPPVANTDSASVPQCESVSVNVIANDTDPNGNLPLVLTGIVSSTKGTATVESSTNVFYTSLGPTGTGVVQYTVSDSLGATATGTLNVNITSGACQ